MKRKLLLLAVLPLLLAGCDSGEEGDSSSSQGSITSTPTSQVDGTSESGTTGATSSVVGTSEISDVTVPTSIVSSIATSSWAPTSEGTSEHQASASSSIATSATSSLPTSAGTSATSDVTSAGTSATSQGTSSTSQAQNPIFKTVKTYLSSLKEALSHNPFSVLPETMLPSNSANFVTSSEIAYDFTNHTDVSSIKYGGFGEQWHMVLENIEESKRFYKVFTTCETVINASFSLHNNYLDNASGDAVSNNAEETGFVTGLTYSAGVLTYTVALKSSNPDGYFGSIKPTITMVYNVATGERIVKVELSNSNVMKFSLTENSYEFGISYGVTAVSRKAYFSLEKQSEDSIVGKIFEYVQFKDKDLVPSAAEFYIDSNYTSVVGNKASAMPGFGGIICEVYKTDTGKLLGYEVRESFTKWGFSATYNTLWFNLNNITGINKVKAVSNGGTTFGLGAVNNYDIYLNNSEEIFTPTYNKKFGLQTSRKYDVEMRKQYFYENGSEGIFEHEVLLPMMFIQAGDNYNDFSSDILSKSGIVASVNLSSTYLNKIQSDYSNLVDTFIEHKAEMTSASIDEFIAD